MSGILKVLYFDDSDATASNWKWVELKNREPNPSYDSSNPISASNLPYAYTGGSPVLSCKIKDEIGLPLECNLILNNVQSVKKPYEVDTNHPLAFGSLPLANGQVNQFFDVIKELTRVIVFDSSNYMTLFLGRVYRTEEPFVAGFGTTLQLRCFDALQELVEISTKDLNSVDLEYEIRTLGQNNSGPLGNVGNTGQVAHGPGNYPATTTMSRWLDHIKHFIQKGTFGDSTTQSVSYVNHKIANGEDYIQAFGTVDANQDTTGKFEANKTDLLKQIQEFSQREKWVDGSLDGRGFDFFLDATRVTPIHSLATVPQQDFTYFRRGLYPTSSPETYGLTVKYATNDVVNDNQNTANDTIRNMFNDFNFAGYASDTITHMSLDYKGRTERTEPHRDDSDANSARYGYEDAKLGKVGNTSDKYPGVIREYLGKNPPVVFTLIYVKPPGSATALPTFRWQHNRTGGHSSGVSTIDPDYDVRTFRQVTSLHKTAGGAFAQVHSSGNNDQNAYQYGFTTAARQYFLDGASTKTWLGNIQFQGETNETPKRHFLILSDPQEDILATLSEDDTLYERGWAKAGDIQMGQKDPDNGNVVTHENYTPTYGTCLFESYPSADMRFKKFGYFEAPETTVGGAEVYLQLRSLISDRLVGGNTKTERMRNGQFRIKDWPHVRWTGQTQSGASGTSFKPVIATNKTPLDYGMRRGCSVTKRNVNGFWAGYVESINASTDIVTAPLFEVVDLGTSAETTPAGAGGWAVDDTYNVYVPYRTGMAVRVDNSMAVTVGDHLITSINYSWENGHVSSEITTVGINDKVMYKTAVKLATQVAPSLTEDAENTAVDRMALAANAYEARGVVWWHNHAYGATPNLAAGNLRDYNTFSWSGGLVKVHSTNKSYKINPGNTDAALAADYYGSVMVANKQYVLYLDTIRGEKADGTYDIQAAILSHDDDGYVYSPGFINMAYLTIGKNESAGSKEIKGNFNPDGSLYTVNIPFDGTGSNGMGMVNIQFMNTFTNVLGVDNQIIEASRIIQPNSLTSALLSKGSRAFSSDLSIRPRNNLYNQILWDGDGSGGAATLTFADDDVVSISAGNTTSGFADNTTNYMYLDGTSAGLTGTLAPQFTTVHGTATGDSKILLALIVVGADATQKSPTILPFNSKAPTINATVIAADAIIATHVQADSIETTKFTAAARAEIAEKTKTHVGNSAPSSPRTMDLWFDTSVNPTVIKVWDGDSWEIRNANAPSGGGATVFYAATGSPPTSVAVNDIWYATDTDIAYIAVTHPANSIETSTEWVKQDVVTAINSASTEINGGLINTAKIILTAGGANILETGTGSSPNAARIELSNTEIAGYSSSGESNKQFNIKASDGKAYFLGGAATVDSTGLTIYSAANQTTKVAQLSTTSGLKLKNGLDGGIWWDDVGAASVYSAINNSTAGSTTYRSGGNLHMYSVVNDIMLQSTTQDILLYPKSSANTSADGKVSIGDSPLVFLESTVVSNKHSAHYIGIWRKAGDITESNIYRLPSTGAADGKVLAIDGTASQAGSVTDPKLWDLEWVDNAGGGSGASDAFKYITLDADSGYAWTASGTATADGATDTLKFIATGDIAVWRNTANSNEPAFKFTLKTNQSSNHTWTDDNAFSGDYVGIGASGATTELRFYETSGSGGNYVGFLPPTAIGGTNVIWTLPATDGGANQILKTDGSGNLDWVNQTDTNTTYSAGDGLDLSGTEFSLDEGFAPTWTAAHNFTNNVNLGNAGTDAITVIGQLRVRNGSASAGDLSIVRSSDATTGFYFYTSNSYKGVYCRGNDRTLWYAASDGSNDWFIMDSWMDMNNHGITECNEIQTTNGTASDPSYTFSSHLTSGMYKGTYGVALTDEGTLSFEVDNTYAYNYKKVYIADIPTGSGGTAIKHVGGTIKEVSSTRLAKMDIQDIVIDSSKIYNLNPVSFRYRTQQVNEDGSSVIDADGTKYYTDVPEGGPDSPLDFGMIAEEVYEHIPELVSVNPKTKKPIGVDYAAFSVLLLEELKKLKARIDVLEGN